VLSAISTEKMLMGLVKLEVRRLYSEKLGLMGLVKLEVRRLYSEKLGHRILGLFITMATCCPLLLL